MNKENASQEISSKERRKSRRKTMDQILQTQITRRDEPIHKEQEQPTEQTSIPHDDQINDKRALLEDMKNENSRLEQEINQWQGAEFVEPVTIGASPMSLSNNITNLFRRQDEIFLNVENTLERFSRRQEIKKIEVAHSLEKEKAYATFMDSKRSYELL
jgi:hypothetical protein